MSRSSLDGFYTKVLSDPGLQTKLRGIADADQFVNTMVTLGKSNGHDFTSDEVKTAIAENQAVYNRKAPNDELSDEQLEAVSGGAGGTITRASFQSGGQPVPAIGTVAIASTTTNSSTCGEVCSNSCSGGSARF